MLARSLVTLFTAAGVTLASVNALDFLRRAVENREATAATVRYIRDYIRQSNASFPAAGEQAELDRDNLAVMTDG